VGAGARRLVQERWCLRLRADESLSESLLEGADALYDREGRARHALDLPLPDLSATLEFQDRVLDRVLARLDREPATSGFSISRNWRSSMRTCTRKPFTIRGRRSAMRIRLTETMQGGRGGRRDVELPGGEFLLGAARNSGFHFDNEKWRTGSS